MRILVVHEVSYQKKPVYEYQDFSERLSASGHEVTVLDFDELGDGNPIDQVVSRTGLANIRLIRPAFSSLRGWKYISAKISSHNFIERALQENKFDAVLLYSVFINGVSTVKLCNKFKVPLVYRTLDAYHLLHANFFARLLLKRGESYIYKNAAKISVTNDHMIPYVKAIARQPLRDEPFVLKHGVDTNFFAVSEPDAELSEKWGLGPDHDVVVFLGTTYNFSSLDSIIREMPSMLKKLPQLRLLIVGGGELDPLLKQLVDDLQLEGRVILTGMVSYDLVPRYLSLAKLAINPFKINSVTENIIPIKVLQYLSCGLPLLSSPLKDVVNNFPESVSGVTYSDVNDIGGFCNKIVDLLFDASNLEELSLAARQYICQNFDINRTLVSLTGVLENLASTDSNGADRKFPH